MSTIIKRKSAFAIALTSALGLGVVGNVNHVNAAQNTGDLAVSATVNANCIFKGGGNDVLNFGAYDPLVANASSPLDQTGTFYIRCTKDTVADIGMGNGANYSGGTRRMAGGSYFLTYQLFSDAGRTSAWGNVQNTDTVEYTATTSGFVSQTVYGRVPGGQDVGAASYSDTVTMTAYF